MSRTQKTILLVFHILSDILLLLLGLFIHLIFALIGGLGDAAQGGGDATSTQMTLLSLYFLIPICLAVLLDAFGLALGFSKKEKTKAKRISVLVFEILICLVVLSLGVYFIVGSILSLTEGEGIINLVYAFVILLLMAGYLTLHILTMRTFCFLKKNETPVS